MPSTVKRRNGKPVTVADVIDAGRRMLRAATPTTPREIQERMDAIDAAMECLTGPQYGGDFYMSLGKEWSRLSSMLSGGSSRAGGLAAGMAARSTRPTRSQPVVDGWYAAAEAEWQRSQERQQLLAQRPKSWQLPPRPPKRVPNGEAPTVRLDADTEPRVTVHISKSAITSIGDECARCGEFETGGWLVGPRASAWHADHNIVEATVAASARTRSSVRLDAAAFLAMDDHLVAERRRGAGHDLRAVGDWHSHPDSVAAPSAGDLACWARDLATLTDADTSLTSLILTQRDGRESWARPVVTAWITRPARSSFGARFVVEPAIVSVQ